MKKAREKALAKAAGVAPPVAAKPEARAPAAETIREEPKFAPPTAVYPSARPQVRLSALHYPLSQPVRSTRCQNVTRSAHIYRLWACLTRQSPEQQDPHQKWTLLIAPFAFFVAACAPNFLQTLSSNVNCRWGSDHGARHTCCAHDRGMLSSHGLIRRLPTPRPRPPRLRARRRRRRPPRRLAPPRCARRWRRAWPQPRHLRRPRRRQKPRPLRPAPPRRPRLPRRRALPRRRPAARRRPLRLLPRRASLARTPPCAMSRTARRAPSPATHAPLHPRADGAMLPCRPITLVLTRRAARAT